MALTATHRKTWAHGVMSETVIADGEIRYTVRKHERTVFAAAVPWTASPRRMSEMTHLQESAARAAELLA
jgi:hypothetical protein